jgi:hypothetical protein
MLQSSRPPPAAFHPAAAAALLALAGGAASADPPAPFPLVRDGRPAAGVVVAGIDDPELAAAVEDLKACVQRISGATLNVVKGDRDLPGPTLHLGETELAAKAPAARASVRGDGFVIVPIGDDLLVAGNTPQGTACGLWTILQDHFGVRWYYAGPLWETVPSSPDLAIRTAPTTAAGVRAENPSFFGRRMWGDPPSLEFGRRMRLNRKGQPLPYVGTGHAINHIVDAAKLGKDHPDYFALVNGRRVLDGDPHPCFTHPDMFGLFMNYVRAGHGAFGVNDNLTACRCDRCLAVDGASAPYLGMVNFSESYCQLIARVAKQAAVEFPGRRFGIFAYQQTNAPPKTVEHLGANVDVVLCQDIGQHFDPAVKRMDGEMAAEWVRKAGGVSFYSYEGIDYWTPRYYPTLLADHMRHLARIGVKGYGTHDVSMPDSSMPMFYVIYQMLWNAELDAARLVDDMLKDLYRESYAPMRDFYAHWEACWMKQGKPRWFKGMDDFRSEMTIYTAEEIEHGGRLLDAALALAKDETVRKRVEWIRSHFAYTLAAVRAHEASMRAIRGPVPASPDEARARSDAVADAWRAYADELARAEKLTGSCVAGWHPKTFRVRAWGLKQQMRDAALAPFVRWACANEGRIAPDALRAAERDAAPRAIEHRKAIDALVVESISAAPRLPRADALAVPDVPRLPLPPPLAAGPDDWPGVPRVDALPWIFRLRPPDQKIGKYDEPMVQNVVEPPPAEDQSITWQCAWDDRRLYVRIVVSDDRHVQGQEPSAMWKEDGVQIALNPRRDDYDQPGGSWDYLMGGYHGDEVEFGIALRDGRTETHVWRSPKLEGGDDPKALIAAAAARHGGRTVYEVSVDWALVKGFAPGAEKSLGLSLVVNDVDHGIRRSAEYGSGVVANKRPGEFAAVRLTP